ncbi:MAG: isoleucine--tRNA ligase [Treponema sp.]|jgi:isoleucyl-tRNA synthetase|nr:isoleucine--tRNA ligase [Treponema sp.]
MYQDVDPKTHFPSLEERVLAFWEANHIFEQSVAQREGGPEFVFYDGPPFATGLPHFGHFVPSTIKDIIPRYKAMRGFHVERRFGWDCHGLPVENLIEKELGLNSKTDIEAYGPARFNEACRASVLRYTSEWRQVITRLGRWVDFDHDYKTMDPAYMETIWWVMQALWERGLLYEGHYILPYCPRCATVLSNHELNLGGYQDVHDPAITVRFRVKGNWEEGGGSLPPRSGHASVSSASPLRGGAAPATPPPSSPAQDTTCSGPATPPPSSPAQDAPCSGQAAPPDPLPSPQTYLLAWTTTPWTLPSNLALTVGPDIDYVMVEDTAPSKPDSSPKSQVPSPKTCYILAESRLGAYFKNASDYTILRRFKGADLAGLEYEPLFPYFADAPGAFRVFCGDFVTTEDGTGIVHTAPGFGEDDARVLKDTGIPVICPVDAECRFTSEVPDYAGRFVKACDKDIIERLKAEGKLVRREQVLHAYPHCWRCGSPLIYRAIGSWFVNIQKIKQDMLDANSGITWVPEHIKAGRFGKWLEGARDWAISRNRYWGNPLPIWRCPDCGKTICVGSRAELKTLSGVYPEDLHKHFVDKISIPCACGGTMRRIPEVLDCWFESGAMPYCQNHYPFENKAFFESHFPADFISEGLDQTRGWFYTLTILAAALFKKPAFKNCIVSGLVLAKDGKKMSKSLRNYTDPMEIVNTYGADALRLFLIHSAVVRADDLRFSDEGVRDVTKSLIIPLWNAYSFFITYANIDKAAPTAAPERPSNPLDRWILSAAETLVEKVTAGLESYDLSRAVDPIVEFIDLCNNWYIRRSRRRFWKSVGPDGAADTDKLEAYASLYSALKTLITVAAPFMPFITEAMWQNMVVGSGEWGVGSRGSCSEDVRSTTMHTGSTKDLGGKNLLPTPYSLLPTTHSLLPTSVHLAPWPTPDASRRDAELEFKMAAVQHAVSMGRSLRSQYNIKVRQPLRQVELVTRNVPEKKALLEMEDIIREELNVKQVLFLDNEEDLVGYEAKANFRVLGKELAALGRGADMKPAAEKIAALSQREIQSLLEGATLALSVEGRPIDITADKVDIRRVEKASLRVQSEGTLTVGLDTEITAELSREGDVRDLVRGLQNLRKESGLDVSDRITLSLYGPPELKAAWQSFQDYVAAETLAVAVRWEETPGMTAIEAGSQCWQVRLSRHSAA